MPGKKIFQQAIKEQCETIVKQLHGYKHDREPEHLHDLRVAIKKIKAIVFLQKKAGSLQRFSVSAPALKKLFSLTGEIRTGKINLRLAEQFGIRKTFRDKIERKIDRNISAFAKSISPYPGKIKADEKRLSQHIVKVNPGKLKHLFKKELSNIKNLLGLEEHWHEARKKMKNLVYLDELRPFRHKKQVKKLQRLEKAIGEWNDVITVLHFLEQNKTGTPASLKKEKNSRSRKVRALSRLLH